MRNANNSLWRPRGTSSNAKRKLTHKRSRPTAVAAYNSSDDDQGAQPAAKKARRPAVRDADRDVPYIVNRFPQIAAHVRDMEEKVARAQSSQADFRAAVDRTILSAAPEKYAICKHCPNRGVLGGAMGALGPLEVAFLRDTHKSAEFWPKCKECTARACDDCQTAHRVPGGCKACGGDVCVPKPAAEDPWWALHAVGGGFTLECAPPLTPASCSRACASCAATLCRVCANKHTVCHMCTRKVCACCYEAHMLTAHPGAVDGG